MGLERIAKRLLSILLKHKDINTCQLSLYTLVIPPSPAFFPELQSLLTPNLLLHYFCFLLHPPQSSFHKLQFPLALFNLFCPLFHPCPEQWTCHPGGAHLPKQSALKSAGKVTSFSTINCGMHGSHAILPVWKGNHIGSGYSGLDIFWKEC